MPRPVLFLAVLLLAVLLGLATNPCQAHGMDDDNEQADEEEEHYHALLGPMDTLVIMLSKPAADDMVVNIVTFDEPCDEHMFENATSVGVESHLHPGEDVGQFDGLYELATHGAIAEGGDTVSLPFYVNLAGKACTLVVLPKWPVSANGLMLLNGTTLMPPTVAFLDASEPPHEEDPCAAHTEHQTVDGLHIAAIFIVLIASVGGAAPPIIFKMRSGELPFLLVMGRQVGTGVLIALALIHMMVAAFDTLSDPCLREHSSYLPEGYHFASLFVLLTVMSMHLMEQLVFLFMMNRGAGDSTANPKQVDGDDVHGVGSALITEGGGINRPLRETIGAYILEFGLTAHSVLIGIALGLTSTDDLPSLLCAIVFHQFFEGVALGARLASVPVSLKNRVFLCAIYSFSCPVGIIIGVATSTTFVATSPSALLTMGLFECFAAGIVIYIALYSMLHDFEKDIVNRSTGERVLLFVSLWTGAGVMALIGNWA